MLRGPVLMLVLLAACDDPQTGTNTEDLSALSAQVAQLQADLDETTDRLELLETTDGWDEDRIASLEGVVTTINGSYASETWVTDQGYATDADLTSLAGDVSTATSRLDAQDSTLAELRTDVDRNTTDALRNTNELTDQASDISDNADAIAALQSDVGTNTAAIATNTSSIATGTTAITTLQSDVSTLQADVTDLESDGGDVETRLTDAEDTLSDLEARGDRHYATFSGNQSRGPATSWANIPGRTLTFTKAEAASGLYIMYHDSVRVTNSGGAWCRYEILIDGRACTAPRAIFTDIYEGTNGTNIHRPSPVAGFCTQTSAGAIGSGSHTITVRWSNPGNKGQCYAGWNSITGHIYVDELTL